MIRLGIIRFVAVNLTIALLCSISVPASALDVTNISIFHDSRGPNDVGQAPGDRLQFGANITGGSDGGTVSAVYPPTGFTDPAAPCGPTTTNPNQCNGSTAYNLNRIASPWNLTFTKGPDSVTVASPSLVGSEFQVPHPTSVTISGSGTTPTISWTLPAGYTPDGFRVQIFDRETIRANGVADIIFTTAVPNNATSFSVPANLGNGQSLQLGGSYSINFQVVETRGNVVFTNSNSQILTRSQSFFAFSPLPAGAPLNVNLPEIDNGVFRFTIDHVGPNEITFIDPAVAIGYKYAIGAGNPNFASVLLPHVGDDIFDLFFNGIHHTLLAGNQFFFPDGGVSAFDVLDIEASAGLDPNNPIGFLTGLTFVTDGSFTGTMTPISIDVAAVPEPETYAMMLAGLGLLAFSARRRKQIAA